MEKIQCSVPILTLNSENFLKRCLDSINNFADVFLLDGNSTDKTLSIARDFNIPVYKQIDNVDSAVQIKDFSAMRRKAIDKCQFDWVLLLDSDEYLSSELVEEIGSSLKAHANDKVIFAIQKRYCINGKTIEYSFNYPNYYPRLHNRKSGAKFKEGKIVHEQMFIHSHVPIIKMEHCVYSEIPATYTDCVKKDKYQLSLMKQSAFAPGSFISRACKIFLKSVFIYLRYGYAHSLPPGHVMRHVRVHLIVSYWRFQQFLFGAMIQN